MLCASTETAVEPLAVPEGAPNGERVMVEGYAADPLAQLPPKKKILEALLPDMLTSAGAATLAWREHLRRVMTPAHSRMLTSVSGHSMCQCLL